MSVSVVPVTAIPQVREGDDLAAVIVAALRRTATELADGDILVVSSKVASKASGLTAPWRDRDAVVAAETVRVVVERATATGVTRVVEAKAGPVMAGAGVDGSNTGGAGLLLLPHDPDAVCRELHSRLTAATGVVRLGVILSDTAGRPWRVGQTDFALGAFGVEACEDLRGRPDADGRPLEVTMRAVADEVAAAADLVKGKARGVPVALVRGLGAHVPDAAGPGGRALVRTGPGDWFSHGPAEAVRAALGVAPGSDLSARLGIASATDEPAADRVRRAVAVAVHGLAGVGVDAGPQRLVVTASDGFELGQAAARLVVALWGEGVAARVVGRSERAATLLLDPERTG